MTLPHGPERDATLAFLREGYAFVGRRCDALGTDGFRTRLMLSPVTCIRGREAAAAFYHPGRFTRRGAMPRTTVRLLQGARSVQALDGAAHRHRKAMFMGLMTRERVSEIAARVADLLEDRLAPGREIVLHEAAIGALAEAALEWTGCDAAPGEVDARAEECAAMVAEAGSVGPSYLRAWRLRRRAERWARATIERARRSEGGPRDATPLSVIARHRDPRGRPLDTGEAATELINLLRPLVAVSRYIVFTAMALRDQPGWRDRLRADAHLAEPFAREVRRLAPFFPVIAGRVLEPFEWRGHAFARDDWVVLDLYGTNRDAIAFDDADAFLPERHGPPSLDPQAPFGGLEPDAPAPQGAGDHHATHRCPGEFMTVAIMREAALRLAALDYAVPDQDLSIDLAAMPALPASGFRLKRAG